MKNLMTGLREGAQAMVERGQLSLISSERGETHTQVAATPLSPSGPLKL